MTSRTRILITDDHAMVRRGFRLILSQYEEFEVVGEAGSGKEALRMIGQLYPQIVLLDLAMPEMNGVEVTQQVARDFPGIRILIVSMHKDAGYVRETLRAGARGYLLKDSADTELIAAVRALSQDNSYICPGVSNAVLSDYQRFVGDPLDLLSIREREVFLCLAEGLTAKAIANKLAISVYTVDAHRSKIMKKLQFSSSGELVRFAMRQGLIQ